MPKVSVIIPVYDRLQYLKQAISSVLSQTYRDFEIIIVDDGSPLNVRDILEPYGTRVRYFRYENRGQAAARNSGIRQAKGEYIALLDDDDTWLPDRLETQVPVLDKNQALAFICSETLIMDAAGHIIGHHRKVPGPGRELRDTFDDLYAGNFISTLTVLIRKTHLLAAGGFDEELRSTEDYDLWLRLAKKHPFIYLNRPLAIYRRYKGQHTTDSGLFDLRIRNTIKVLSKSELSHDIGFLRRRIRKARVYHYYAYLYRKEGQYWKAGVNYCRAVVSYPFFGSRYRSRLAAKMCFFCRSVFWKNT